MVSKSTSLLTTRVSRSRRVKMPIGRPLSGSTMTTEPTRRSAITATISRRGTSGVAVTGRSWTKAASWLWRVRRVATLGLRDMMDGGMKLTGRAANQYLMRA